MKIVHTREEFLQAVKEALPGSTIHWFDDEPETPEQINERIQTRAEQELKDLLAHITAFREAQLKGIGKSTYALELAQETEAKGKH